MPGRSIARSALALLAVCALVGACGDDDDSSSSVAPTDAPTTTLSDNEQLCADRDALESSIRDLTNVDVVATGTDGVRQALTEVKDDVDALAESASEDFQPEVQAVKDALGDLESALNEGTSSGMSGIVSAAQAVLTSGSKLLTSLRSVDCG